MPGTEGRQIIPVASPSCVSPSATAGIYWSFPLEEAPAVPALGPAGVSLLPHSLWTRGDPSPRRGEAPEETLLWL